MESCIVTAIDTVVSLGLVFTKEGKKEKKK